MRVTILDYGVGNLHSIGKALASTGVSVAMSAARAVLESSDALVLPGVGAFAPAARRLAPLRETLRAMIAGGRPVLGICLGMQLLFEASDEGEGDGLGVFAGPVTRLRARRLPQLGWNAVEWRSDPPFELGDFREAYYANSFVCRATDRHDVIGWSVHEADRFVAAVRRGACMGVQFHPEKSGRPGVAFLRAWVRSFGSTITTPVRGVPR